MSSHTGALFWPKKLQKWISWKIGAILSSLVTQRHYLKKRGHKAGVFAVLQNLTHIWPHPTSLTSDQHTMINLIILESQIPWMRYPRIEDPAMKDPRMKNPRIKDPRIKILPVWQLTVTRSYTGQASCLTYVWHGELCAGCPIKCLGVAPTTCCTTMPSPPTSTPCTSLWSSWVFCPQVPFGPN